MADQGRALSGFEERNSFATRNRPLVERVITEALAAGPLDFEWIEADSPDFELDRQLGIDLKVEGRRLGRLTAQVKTLSTDFKTVCVESWEGDGSEGDLWTCSAALYVVVYVAPDGAAVRWAVLDWGRMILASMRGQIRWRSSKNADGRAQASFVFADLVEIEAADPAAVIARSTDW